MQRPSAAAASAKPSSRSGASVEWMVGSAAIAASISRMVQPSIRARRSSCPLPSISCRSTPSMLFGPTSW